MSTPFRLIAKAGGSAEGPENTCEAVAAAVSSVVPPWASVAVEVDLRITADGALVAVHDATLERTTNGTGLVRSATLASLRELHAGPRGERVATFEEICEAAGDHELLVEPHDADLETAVALVAAIGRLRSPAQERIIVASNHAAVVRSVRRLAPQLRTGATASEVRRKMLLERLRIEVLSPRGHTWIVPLEHEGLSIVTPRFVKSANRAGDSVWTYMVEEACEALRLRGLGVTGCVTTRPRALGATLLSS